MPDTLTGGRVVAGMLRGDVERIRHVRDEPGWSRVSASREALELIVKTWTEPQPFGWQGRYFEYRTISIWPRPVQRPHPPIYMSGSSPESGEFAARNHLSLGFAVTTVPLASAAAGYYREQCSAYGWSPVPEDVLYRLTVHVGASDADALADLEAAGAGAPRAGVARSNRVLDDTVANLGYYGRDMVNQRGRLQPHTLAERIELGQ